MVAKQKPHYVYAMKDTILDPIVLNPKARAGVIVLCEHASNHVPEGYANLGLSDEDLE